MTDLRSNNDEDYISFERVKAVLFSVVKAVFHVGDRIAGLLLKYWMLFLILIVTGTGIGYLLKRVVTYNSELTLLIKFNDLNRSTFTQIINSLDDLANSKAYESLASELNLKPQDARLVSKLTIEKQVPEEGRPIDTSKAAPLQVIVSLRSITASDAVQIALLNYLNNNPYIRKLKDGQLAVHKEELSFIESELRKLDSLKTEYNKSINSGRTTTLYYNAFNPGDIYARSQGLMAMKEQTVMWFATEQNAVNLISAFKQEKIVSSRSADVVIIGFLTGLFLSFLFAILLELRTLVRQSGEKGPNQSGSI